MYCRLTGRFRIAPLAAATMMILVAASCDSNKSSSQSPFPDASLPDTTRDSKSGLPATRDKNEVKVTVKGAVIKPGVYVLDRQANVAQAILEAGGLSDQAVLDTLNLKSTLRDNMTIVVPAVSRPAPGNSTRPENPSPASPLSIPQPKIKVTPSPSTLMVVVKGAVTRPGVYQLSPGSIVASAIVASGGLASNANIEAINLQQPLRQGMTINVPVRKIVITREMITPAPLPRLPEPAAPPPADAEPNVRSEAVPAVTQSPMNINSATVTQLQGLPGIGPSLAARIVTYRKEVGAFRTPEQLMDVKGITPEKYSQIQSLVRTD